MGNGEELRVALGETEQKRSTEGAGKERYFWTGGLGRDSWLDSTAGHEDTEESGWPNVTTAVRRAD